MCLLAPLVSERVYHVFLCCCEQSGASTTSSMGDALSAASPRDLVAYREQLYALLAQVAGTSSPLPSPTLVPPAQPASPSLDSQHPRHQGQNPHHRHPDQREDASRPQHHRRRHSHSRSRSPPPTRSGAVTAAAPGSQAASSATLPVSPVSAGRRGRGRSPLPTAGHAPGRTVTQRGSVNDWSGHFKASPRAGADVSAWDGGPGEGPGSPNEGTSTGYGLHWCTVVFGESGLCLLIDVLSWSPPPPRSLADTLPLMRTAIVALRTCGCKAPCMVCLSTAG